jgi:hypothetical protein
MSETTSAQHEEILDDLPALLTGELSPAREREVANHLDGCDSCRRELSIVARASAWLQDAVRLEVAPEMLPDDGRPHEPVTLPPLQLPRHSWMPTPRRAASARGGQVRNRWLAAAAVVLVAAGVLGGVVVGRASDSGTASSHAIALHPVPGGVPVGGAVGEATLAADGGMKLSVNGLPNPPGQDFYEIWLYDPPSGRMLAVGVLPPTGKGSYSLPRTVENGYGAVEISLEPNDGNPAHSKLSVLRGQVA